MENRSRVSFFVAGSFTSGESLGNITWLMDERATHLTFVNEAVLWESPVHTWHFRTDEAIRPWQGTWYILALICLVHELN